MQAEEESMWDSKQRGTNRNTRDWRTQRTVRERGPDPSCSSDHSFFIHSPNGGYNHTPDASVGTGAKGWLLSLLLKDPQHRSNNYGPVGKLKVWRRQREWRRWWSLPWNLRRRQHPARWNCQRANRWQSEHPFQQTWPLSRLHWGSQRHVQHSLQRRRVGDATGQGAYLS